MLSGPITFDDAQKASKKAIEREESERGMTPLAPSPVMPLQEEGRVTQPVGEVGNELGVGLRRRPRVKTCSTPIVKGFDLWGVSVFFAQYFIDVVCLASQILRQSNRKTKRPKTLLLLVHLLCLWRTIWTSQDTLPGDTEHLLI